MSVAHLEQRTAHEHGDVERAAGDELAIVEIAGVTPRRVAAHPTGFGRGRDPHAAEEWAQRHDDAGCELGAHGAALERDDAHGHPWLAVLRQHSAAAVVAVVDREIDREDPHLEHIAGLCALDEHGTGEDVTPGAAALPGHLGDDRLE